MATTPARPNPNCYWVIPGRLLAGEYPGALGFDSAHAKLTRYLEAGVTYFLDLTDPADGLTAYHPRLAAAAASRHPLTHRQFTIRDLDVPTPAHMTAILDALEAALAAGERVYVHCWGGIGRTGTVVGCYLVRQGLTGDEALAQLAEWWRTVEKSSRHPRSPQTDAQVAFVRGWAEAATG